MAHGIKNMSRQNVCPICGKPDYCGWMPASDGGDLVFCNRCTEPLAKGDGVMGHDGNYYIKVGMTRSEHPVFEEANQRLAKQKLKQGMEVKYVKPEVLAPRTLTPVDIIEPLDNKKLDAMYQCLLDNLFLEDADREYLLEEGWSNELIDRYKIRTFPMSDYERFKKKGTPESYSRNPWRKTLGKKLEDEFGSLAGMPGAYQNTNGNWTFYGEEGILFPLFDADGCLYRLRIRLHHPKPDGGKYRNFSSFKEDKEAAEQGFLMNKLPKGSRAGNNIGFYMNPSFDDMHLAYITEGEKKGIYGESILKNPFISIPGISSYAKLFEGKKGMRPVDTLKSRGIHILVIAYDADKKNNPMVWESQEKTVEKLKKEGFTVGVANWNIEEGKGIDDLLKNGGRPLYDLR